MAKKAKKPVVKKTRRGPVILPMKMSSLIAIALKDIRKAEKLPKQFVVDMGTYFSPEEVECRTENDVLIETHHVCTLCAAGSVMAFSLGEADNKTELSPSSFPKNECQLEAINCLRRGEVARAAMYLGLGDEDDRHDYNQLNTTMPGYYRDDPERFHKAMGQLLTKLKKAKL